MQNPVGYRFNPDTNRAELIDFWAVMVNKVQLVTFPHVILAAYMTAGAFLLGVGAYLYMKKKHEADRPLYHRAIRIGAAITLLAGIGVAITGDLQGKVMTEVQPMKMAAAEGLYETSEGCAPFSVFTVGTPDGKEEKFSVTIPCLLSFLGTGSFDGTVQGINPLSEQYVEEYGQDPTSKAYTEGDYTPVIPITYWSFRFMMGLGFFAAGGAALILWLTRKGRTPGVTWLGTLGLSLPIAVTSGQLVGLDLHRDGPPAVGGLRADDHRVRGLPQRVDLRGGHVAHRAHRAVRRAGRRGDQAARDLHRKGADPFEEPPRVSVGGSDDDAPLTFAY